ncbi:DsbA family oxidoreductase [Deinococcus cellulosilyticus]|uniref:DSBA oxidoreductase n=1 Tax=Deinococcus cellulosilyticus (strain DSM 18568 / NBRC 106333 / KACC 11606 / 5516J-15) TaxID=1223518 RepID=A0A511MXI5_DEIC1|nr:DsbA family oxidoreductase [Deinococcus cellulosilyticus]GEM45294.1 DSBA oxidoreductase [Deinococcus cellulosilyticus NBRC 106333 = KACC 11606]
MNEQETLICEGDVCEVRPAEPQQLKPMNLKPSPTLNIQIVSDWVCPFCPIGEANLQKGLDLLRQSGTWNGEATVEMLPFQLNPEIPMEGTDHVEHLSKKFGSKARMEQMQDMITEKAKEAGWEYRFDRVTVAPNTIHAHRLARFAQEKGKQPEITQLLFKAYFTEGKNLSDLKLLTEIGVQAGLDREEVSAYLHSDQDVQDIRVFDQHIKRQGVQGVPFFIISERYIPLFQNAC